MLRIESNNNASLTLKNTNANAGGGEYQLFTSSSSSNPALGAGSLAIYYDHPSAAAYRFSINTAGNVGIGTGMPTEKLDVAGNVKASGTIKAGTITYPNTAGTSGYYLKTDGTGTASWAAVSGAGVPYSGATGAVNLEGYDLTVNGLTVGTGKVNGLSTHNTIVGGSGVPRTFTSVLGNTAIGYNTLTSSTPGDNNTVVGAWSLVSNSGAKNSAMGVGALERNLGGNENTAIGYYALRGNTTGSNNTAIGYAADMSDGLSNATAIGSGASVAASNTIQLGNTSVTNVKTSGTITAGAVTYPKTDGTNGQVLTTNGSGTLTWAAASSSSGVPYTGASQAVNLGLYDLTVNGMTIGSGKVNSTATLNTIIGEYALNRANTYRGTDNTAIGYKAMGNESASTTSAGTKNIAVGSWTLVGNSGQENSAVGVGAMEQNQGGSQNTAMGGRALTANSSGSSNTAVGYNSLKSNSTGSQNTTIGSEANVASGALTNATAIGYNASVAASNTIQLGNTAVTNVKTSGTITAGAITYPNTAGTNGQVLTSNGAGTSSWATSAGVPYTGATGAVNLGDYNLTVYGLTVGRGGGGKNSNVAIGINALPSNHPDAAENTAIGYAALISQNSSSARANTATGFQSLEYNQSGQENSAFGHNALKTNTASYNTAIGSTALQSNTTGTYNTAIGKGADVGTGNLTNATAIGNGATVVASNTIQLGNTSVTDVKTSGTITAAGLAVTGNVTSTSGSISGFDAALNNQTGTTYTLTSADNGKVVTLNNASAITLTINTGLGDGFNCLIVQKGAGQITIAGDATKINRQGHTKTAGQYAVVSIVNIGGDNVIVAGDTGS
jgi:hypothetical protein